MNNIIACIGFFQDRKAGQRLLDNLKELNIPSIWCDSRVKGFMRIDNSDISTDGLPEIISSYPKTTLYQLGKRNPGEATMYMFQRAKRLGYEYVIVLGCDEYIKGDWELLKDTLPKLNLKEPARIRIPIIEHNPENHNAKFQGRIIYKPEYVKIKSTHWMYYSTWNNKEKLMGDLGTKTLHDIEVHHDDFIRDKFRNSLMDVYQKQIAPTEQLEIRKIRNKK